MSANIPEGTLIGNRYKIVKQLGQGGMGEVFLAIDEQTGKQVALKRSIISYAKAKQDFDIEKRTLANLDHPALPRVLGSISDSANEWMVMDFIEGRNLSSINLKEYSVNQRVYWAEQVLDALEYLHFQTPPIIHRDIKPQNIQLTPNGQVFLLDFGLSKSGNTSKPGWTPDFAPLEQMYGKGTDVRTDVYSMGVTLYYLFTGVLPPRAEVREAELSSRKTDPLTPARSLNPELSQYISDALDVALKLDPKERYQNASEMRRAVCLDEGVYQRTSENLKWEDTGVFTAIDLSLGRNVLIRYWREGPEATAAAETIRLLRDRHEAHPQLPAILNVYNRGPYYCVVMADEQGDRVDEVLRNLRGPFPAPQVFPWAKQLIGMLSQLHQIHDPPLRWTIQPQNLMIHQPLAKGRIRLWEYGLSADPDPADRYAAPEEHAGKRTNQSDIYRVGAVLYHLLTGKVPPSAQARQSRVKRGQADPLEINNQSSDAIQWLAPALALDPSSRYPDADSMRVALSQVEPEVWDPGQPEPLPKPSIEIKGDVTKSHGPTTRPLADDEPTQGETGRSRDTNPDPGRPRMGRFLWLWPLALVTFILVVAGVVYGSRNGQQVAQIPPTTTSVAEPTGAPTLGSSPTSVVVAATTSIPTEQTPPGNLPVTTDTPPSATPIPVSCAPPAPLGETPYSTPGPELAIAFTCAYSGTNVVVEGPFSPTSEEGLLLQETLKYFQDHTGITIVYTSTGNFENSIAEKVEAGEAPDIANFPQPGLLESLVQNGKVIDLTTVISQEWLRTNYPWGNDEATMQGPNGEVRAGIWWRVSYKSLVWYSPAEFERYGYQVPTIWDIDVLPEDQQQGQQGMRQLMDQMVANGHAPWCIGIQDANNTAATGWVATDWMEDIMLRTTSLENYDKWVRGELPFTDQIVKDAAGIMSEIWLNPDYVFGGPRAIVTTTWQDAPAPMFDEQPKCFLHKQASFITNYFPVGKAFPADYNVFYFPPIDPTYDHPMLYAGDIMAMFNDRPEVRAVMQYLTLGESLKVWLNKGGTFSPHKDTQDDWYGSLTDRRVADIVRTATTYRFDASDQMPKFVGQGTFWEGMTDYTAGIVDLDEAMEAIQKGWTSGPR